MVSIIILLDHRRIRGPSLTETSLCGAYLYWCFYRALFGSESTYVSESANFNTACLNSTYTHTNNRLYSHSQSNLLPNYIQFEGAGLPLFPTVTIAASKTWRVLGWVRNICLNCIEVGLQFQNWIRFPAWVWCNNMPVPALRGAFDLCAGVAHLSPTTGRGGSLSCSETWNPLSGVQYTLVQRPIFNTQVGDESISWLSKRILVLHKLKLVTRLGQWGVLSVYIVVIDNPFVYLPVSERSCCEDLVFGVIKVTNKLS